MGREPANWYVMINDAQTGPLTRVELGVELNSGTITGESLVWKEGMVGWLPGAKVPELASLFTNPPKSPRAAAAAKPKKPQEKGSGMSDFDTAHFNLNQLDAEDNGKGKGQMDFDTAHFRVAELAADDNGQSRNLEFDTAHFRLQELKGAQGARAAVPRRIAPAGQEPAPIPISDKAKKAGLKQLSTGTGKPSAAPRKPSTPPPAPAKKQTDALELAAPSRHTPAPAARPAPSKPAAKKPAFDANSTAVDFVAYGAQVQQQNDAQDLFQSSLAGQEPDPQPAVHQPEPDHPLPKYVRPPTAPIHIPRERGVPVWVMIAGGLAMVAAVVLYFVVFD